MSFIRVWFEEFARAHSEATREALTYQRRQAGAAPAPAPASVHAGRGSSVADRLIRLLELWRAGQSAG